MIRAIDPPGCGCTDCLTGYSRPLDHASDDEIAMALCGALDNRTSAEPEIHTVVHVTWCGQTWRVEQ